MAIITQSNVKVTVSSMAGDWSKVDGGGGSFASEKVRTTAGGAKQVLTSELEMSDITVTAIFDPQTHAGLIDQLKAGQTYPNTTITVQYIESGVITKQNAYTGCAVTSWEPPTGDANAEGAAEWTVTWAVPAS